jgi:hypothetical protein
MITAGGHAAWMVYRYLGLKLVSQRWFNLDAIWTFSLILVGALSLSIGMAGWHRRPDMFAGLQTLRANDDETPDPREFRLEGAEG